MFVIVGLGNPGKKYEKTRHNMGFLAIDKLAEKHDIKVNKLKHKALVGDGFISGRKALLDFPRIRIGIGKSGGGAEWKDFVLGKTSKQDEKLIEDAVERTADAVGCILEKGIDKAMNEYNVKPGLSGRE